LSIPLDSRLRGSDGKKWFDAIDGDELLETLWMLVDVLRLSLIIHLILRMFFDDSYLEDFTLDVFDDRFAFAC
jgi:hypothetical protein